MLESVNFDFKNTETDDFIIKIAASLSVFNPWALIL